MTLLIAWVRVYTHGTASAYMASDSRITWGNLAKFDHGRKVFAFRNSPDILGYCGDVLFPTIVLSQIAEMADRGLLFSSQSSCKEKFESIKQYIVLKFMEYPKDVSHNLEILHISRDPINHLNFECRHFKWDKSKTPQGSFDQCKIPTISKELYVLGSGCTEFNENLKRYRKGPNRETSRNIFHCFCDTLTNIHDNRCGGAPQLVGIYRKPNSPAITVGIIKEKKRYFLGAEIKKCDSYEGVEWRNQLFEICDGESMQKTLRSQSQPDPLRRK